jgi:hypothetical protein
MQNNVLINKIARQMRISSNEQQTHPKSINEYPNRVNQRSNHTNNHYEEQEYENYDHYDQYDHQSAHDKSRIPSQGANLPRYQQDVSFSQPLYQNS